MICRQGLELPLYGPELQTPASLSPAALPMLVLQETTRFGAKKLQVQDYLAIVGETEINCWQIATAINNVDILLASFECSVF